MYYKLQYKIILWGGSIDTSYYKNHVNFFLQVIITLKNLKITGIYKNLDITKGVMKEINITQNLPRDIILVNNFQDLFGICVSLKKNQNGIFSLPFIL